jgi:DNA-binding response OmpR family regulator
LFLVYLPASAEPSAKSSIVPGEGVKRSGKETILLVEDDPGVRAYVETVLKDLGYDVLSANDAEQARETFESYSSSIDLLLTDAVLPGESGPNLARRLRRARPQLKVLFMSGYLDDAYSRGLELGVDAAFVGKPFSPDLLASRLRDVFDTAFSPRPKVLVADDDPSIRALLAGAIEFAGFEAFEARDGRETLKICAENDITLVVTDLAMPRQEGLETIQALRRTLPHVQIIAFSGLSASAGVLAAAKHLGAAAIFPKPLEVGELIDKIRQLLRD